MQGTPLLSVLTASRNRRTQLLDKLETLRQQDLQPGLFEWIVSLDDSEDDSEAALGLVLDRQPPAFSVTVAANPGQRGAAAARNHAAQLARGRLLLLSDDDVLLPPGCLSSHIAAHSEPGRVVIGELRLPEHLRAGSRREPFEQLGGRPGRGLWINVTGANTSLPAAAFQAVGGYDETFSGYGGEDSDLGLRLKGAGNSFIRSAAAWAYHDGRVLDDTDKAYAAGRAGVKVWRKLGSGEAAVMLGVHPLLLQLKRVMLSPPLRWLMPPGVADYEAAYVRGARAELRENRE